VRRLVTECPAAESKSLATQTGCHSSGWRFTLLTLTATVVDRDLAAGTKQFVGSSRYVNYLGDDEHGDAVVAAYGPNYQRLMSVKAKYDPENFFHLNQNIGRPNT
jgi:hypothetical protein